MPINMHEVFTVFLLYLSEQGGEMEKDENDLSTLPAVGIAQIGNSETGYFLGPEAP